MPRFHSSVSRKRDEQTVYAGSTDGKSKHKKVHNSTRNERHANRPVLRCQHMLVGGSTSSGRTLCWDQEDAQRGSKQGLSNRPAGLNTGSTRGHFRRWQSLCAVVPASVKGNLNESRYIKCLEQFSAHSQSYVSVNHDYLGEGWQSHHFLSIVV